MQQVKEKAYVLIVRTHAPREHPNPHSKKRIMKTVRALEADGYHVEIQREIV